MAVSLNPAPLSKADFFTEECLVTLEQEIKSKKYNTLHTALKVLLQTRDDFESKQPLICRNLVHLMSAASKQKPCDIPRDLIRKVMLSFAASGLFKTVRDKTRVECANGEIYINKTIFSLMNPICAKELAETNTLDFSKLTVKSASLLRHLFYRRKDGKELLERDQFLETYKILAKFQEMEIISYFVKRVSSFTFKFLSEIESYEMEPKHKSILQRKILNLFLEEEYGVKSKWLIDGLLIDAKHLYLLEQQTPFAMSLKKYVSGILLSDEDDTKYLEFLPLLDPSVASKLKTMHCNVPFTAKSLPFLSDSFSKTQIKICCGIFKYDCREMDFKKRLFDTKVIQMAYNVLTAWVKNGDEFKAFLEVISHYSLMLKDPINEYRKEMVMIELTSDLYKFIMTQKLTIKWASSLIFLINGNLVPQDFNIRSFDQQVSNLFNVKLVEQREVHDHDYTSTYNSKPLQQILSYRG